MLKGVTIIVGEEEMILPPMNIGIVEDFYDAITGGLNTASGLKVMRELVHTTLLRNYPDLTMEDFRQKVSLVELTAAIPKLLAVSGFEVTKPGESLGSVTPPTGKKSKPKS